VPAIDVPTLRDGALTLRPPRREDAEAVTAACQDPQIQRWVGVPVPYERAHAEAWLAGAPQRARAGEAVNLLAEEDGRLAGSFSLLEIDRDRGYGEIGYWVAPHARRRGVATRAVALMRAWARDTLGLGTIEILVHRDNEPSCGAARRAGFRDTGALRAAPRREDADPPAYKVFIWQA
jgi:RimJ/RimL family protein N-acetyltransferase